MTHSAAVEQISVPSGERTALKEWAVLVDAMARGELCAMIRKGGIREQRAGFSVRHDRFLLYPTFFHENTSDLAPSLLDTLGAAHARKPADGTIEVSHVGNVRAVWKVTDLDALRAIQGAHGLSWDAVVSRFNYKDKPGVHVVAVSLSRLPEPVTIPEVKRYLGCVSWVELDQDINVSGALPITDAALVERRIQLLHDALGEPLAEQVV